MNQYGSRKASELTYEQQIFLTLSHNPFATKKEIAESIGTTEIYTHIDRNMLRSEIIEHHPRNIKFREKDNKGSIF